MMNGKWKGGANRAVGKGSLAVLVLLVGASVSFAHAARDMVHIETCLVAASAVKAGDYLKVEYLAVSPRGVPTYEIEVRGTDGREWELMCDALTGTIYEIEQEATGSSGPLFREKAKVSEEEARAKALRRLATIKCLFYDPCWYGPITEQQTGSLSLKRDRFHDEWNYTLLSK